MKKTVLVPLDSRPVCTHLPESLGQLCGWKITLPPREMLGGLHVPADTVRIFKWLKTKALKNAERLIISTDLLCYGGLVYSRDDKTELDCAIANIGLITQLKQLHPGLKIIAFSVVLRDSITVRNNEDFKLWKKLSTGKAVYPEWYLETRKRNHAINKELIKLVADGVVDFALFGKEDTAPGNPFKFEIDALSKEVRNKKVRDKVEIINGTDEMPQLLIAREFCKETGITPAIFPDCDSKSFLESTPLFESQPIGMTLKTQVRLVGGRISRDAKNHDLRLYIHAPAGPQKDLFTESLKALKSNRNNISPAHNKSYYKAITDKINKTYTHFAIADLAYANGADPALVETLLKEGVFFKALSYAAWNTASNALGTVVATACVAVALIKSKKTSKAMLEVHLNMLLERLFDDYLYQTRIRPQLSQAFAQPHDVENRELAKKLLAEMIISERNYGFDAMIFGKNIVSGMLDTANVTIKSICISEPQLPWNRIFEAEIIPKATLEKS